MNDGVVKFHVRYIRHGREGRSYEFDSIEGAIGYADTEIGHGFSAQQEIWCGDDLVLDHAATVKRCSEAWDL